MSSLSGEVASCGDIYLWERYTKRNTKPDGSLELEIVEGGTPDGVPIKATVAPGWTPRQAMETWYNYVMGEIRARETSETPKSPKPAKASDAGGGQDDQAARVNGRGAGHASPPVQDSEATVEEVLEAKIAALGRSVTEYEAKVAAAAAELVVVESKLAALKLQKSKAISALKKVKEVAHA